MLLPIEADQLKQKFEPLLRRKTPVVGAVRGVGLGWAVEYADDTLHRTHCKEARTVHVIRRWTHYE